MTNQDMMESKVRNWMTSSWRDYAEEGSYEINCTGMAEDAATQFKLHEDDVDATIPEWVFEIAFEVAEQIENNDEEDL